MYDTPEHAEPCVWMSAGLVAYKLCDRDFDCERCLLDAALRGGAGEATPRVAPLEGGPREGGFPADRRYSTGHTWVGDAAGLGPAGGQRRALRVGIDAFAAELARVCTDVRWASLPLELARDQALCELVLDVGVLPLGAPVPGRALRGNPALESHPELVVREPYGAGWLVELLPAREELPGDLLGSGAVAERAQEDLRRLRRGAALQMLVDAGGLGPSLPDGGERLTDLRRILGGGRFLALLRELIH